MTPVMMMMSNVFLSQEDTPPVVAPQQPEADQPSKESQNKLVPTSEQVRTDCSAQRKIRF